MIITIVVSTLMDTFFLNHGAKDFGAKDFYAAIIAPSLGVTLSITSSRFALEQTMAYADYRFGSSVVARMRPQKPSK